MWMPNGHSFKITDYSQFEKYVLPIYFDEIKSYRSFRRQLNNYGIYHDRGTQTYSHEFLVRGQRKLCDKISRKKRSRYRPRGGSTAAARPRDLSSSYSSSSDLNITLNGTTMTHPKYNNTYEPNPVDFEMIANSANNYRNHPLRSFVTDQHWRGLPNGISPFQIVGEIIATFRRPQETRRQGPQEHGAIGIVGVAVECDEINDQIIRPFR
eukprot:jgi/Psemu1/313721/fgenesh1_kg.1284_\